MLRQWPSSQSLSLIQLFLLSLGFMSSALTYPDYPVPPDRFACTKDLGLPLSQWRCQAAVNNLPKGRLPSIFTTRPRSPGTNWIQVPQQYSDSGRADHGCTITIDLDGHSNDDVFVLVPYDSIREMAQVVVDDCVGHYATGGYITYGLGRSLQALTGPDLYDLNGNTIPTPAWTEQPDGSIDAVAMPYNDVPDGGYNIPYYMTITISASWIVPSPEIADYQISLGLMDSVKSEYVTATSPTRQNDLSRLLEGLQNSQYALIKEPYHRWWEFPLEPLAPDTAKSQYTCDRTLGSPRVTDCDAAMYEFVQPGQAVLDPTTPIIKVSGNCAITVTTKGKHSTPWDMLRSAAQNLLVNCIANPSIRSIGGMAISQSIKQTDSRRIKRRRGPGYPSSFEITIYLQGALTGPSPERSSVNDSTTVTNMKNATVLTLLGNNRNTSIA